MRKILLSALLLLAVPAFAQPESGNVVVRSSALPAGASTEATLSALGTKAETAQTSGGNAVCNIVSTATTNATSCKASAGQVYSIVAYNQNAAPRFLHIYNLAASPTVGTSSRVAVLPIPASATGAGFVVPIPYGWAFSTGIAASITTGIASTDTGATAANEVVVNIWYK